MLIKMKRYEQLAGDHAKRFAKAWDYFCIATGAYLAGYRQAKADVVSYLESGSTDSYFDAQIVSEDIGNEEIEVELKDGEHQLSATSFKKWKEENLDLPLKDAMKAFLPQFNFEDLRVEEKDGLISFQGTARKK